MPVRLSMNKRLEIKKAPKGTETLLVWCNLRAVLIRNKESPEGDGNHNRAGFGTHIHIKLEIKKAPKGTETFPFGILTSTLSY